MLFTSILSLIIFESLFFIIFILSTATVSSISINSHEMFSDKNTSLIALFISLLEIKSSTSINYHIPNYLGTFGIIPAFTRTICNDCNRIRITATGTFKNCLFDGGTFNVRDFIRKGASDNDLKELFINTVHHKPENGFIAEATRGSDVSESMSTIGG